jgi:hypothetical protein
VKILFFYFLRRIIMSKKSIYFVSFVLMISSRTLLYGQDPSLILYFSFDDEPVDEAMDHSQYRNNGTVEGSPQSVVGQFGSALMFDASDDQIVVPTNAMLDIETEITMMLWAMPGPNLTADWRNLVGKSPTNVLGNTTFSYSVRTDNSGALRFSLNLGSWQYVLGPTLEEDTWYHITGTYDGTQLILYVDGESVGTTEASGTINVTPDPVCIGNLVNAAGASQNEFWSGVIDEVRIWDRALEADEVLRNMALGREGLTKPVPFAWRPEPADGAMLSDTWTNLSWRPGDLAVSHDIYIGDDFDAVNEGAEGTFIGNQTDTFIVVGFPGFPIPDGLAPGTTYYWRIDEVNEAEPNSPWKGPIWSFSVPPKTAYFPDPADKADGVSVNVKLSWTGGYGSKLHTVYFGETFEEVDKATGGSAQGSTVYTPGTLKMAKTYYWRVDEFDIVETHKGDVWSFTTEGGVSNPAPAKGAVDVSQIPVLTWTHGLGATYEIYFGTDASALEKKASGSLGSESYEPGQLEWNTTYYWRIDEADNANADSPWTGPLWSFTTANFLIIDDFESYNDIEEATPDSNRIYNAWWDGYDDPTNGSQTGHLDPPFYEETIVHSGNKSMPMYFDNTVGKSEATLTLTSNRDWTVNGVTTLTIWFRGASGNAAEQMYVALDGSARIDHDDPDAATSMSWKAWNIDLQAFADQGVNLSNVNSITLGLSSVTGGTGIMYFDDIRLYPPAP